MAMGAAMNRRILVVVLLAACSAPAATYDPEPVCDLIFDSFDQTIFQDDASTTELERTARFTSDLYEEASGLVPDDNVEDFVAVATNYFILANGFAQIPEEDPSDERLVSLLALPGLDNDAAERVAVFLTDNCETAVGNDDQSSRMPNLTL